MTPEEELKKRGITAITKHHDYNYLYSAVLSAMEARDQQQQAKIQELVEKWEEDRTVHYKYSEFREANIYARLINDLKALLP